MKKVMLFLALMLGMAMPSLAYDITFDNNVVKIKKSAIKQIYLKDGDIYDSYTSSWRDNATVTFSFVSGAADPNGWKLVTAYRNYYKAPSGEENITEDSDYLNIPFSVWAASGTIQIEPENVTAVHGQLLDILPFKKTGTSYTGFLIKHYFDYWVYSN